MKPRTTKSNGAIDLKRMVRALRHRNYRLFFAGQGISLIGTWMQRIAMGWLVYRLTNSAFLLGLVGFTGQLPIFLLTPVAGVLADRLNRHRMLVVTQTLAMMQALALALLILTGTIAVWHIVSLSIFLGFVDALDMPFRQSFLVEMIEKREDLGNAIALNSSIVNSARLIGPSIAGILIAYVGEGVCFLLNAISYLAVIASLLAMKIVAKRIESPGRDLLQGVQEGFSYAFGFAPIRSVLLLISLMSLLGMPLTVLMPVFARDILHGDSHMLGFLMGASGTGALVGAVYLASRRSVLGLEKWTALACGIFGVGLIIFSQSRNFFFSLLLMFTTGFGMMVQNASGNTLLQAVVDEDKRGRVMSLFTMAFRGMVPFGSLLGGSLASKIGAPNTVLIGGASCVLGALLFARGLPSMTKEIRSTYARKGIVPEG
ncbi:MAG: MFS transporter [Deltaproteobacteria bacterium RBG_13_52_11b]|nr:MAG: MFS transporter [Deltaproteobacteria bacterium RBG_13_52_11b]